VRTKRTSSSSSRAPRHYDIREDAADAGIPIWKEALFGAELLLLHASPVFYGLGVPLGDGSAVVVIPGFLGTDLYLTHLAAWLDRIGYRAYVSGIGLNAECPNLLIKYRLADTVDRALRQTRRKVHLIGHSLGGVMARSVAAQRPDDVASVTMLGAPIRGTVLNHSVLNVASAVRRNILSEHGDDVLPECYTPRCSCDFVNSLRCRVNGNAVQTAIYTRDDGVVDWHYCRTGDEAIDVEVSGTHMGLVFNPAVYAVIAERLAGARKGPRRISAVAKRSC
jgi:pimeloyl-ACP methyl ester carboxylesterase